MDVLKRMYHEDLLIDFNEEWITIQEGSEDIGIDIGENLDELDFVINSLQTIRQELLEDESER